MAFRAEIADFGHFYERTYQSAYRTALAIVRDAQLAEEVTQDAFASAFRRRDQFKGESPGLAWLHRIVVNTAISSVRRRRPVVRELTVIDGGRHDDTQPATDRLVILAALAELSPKQRAAVVLRYYHDYDYATIARILGTTTTNVGAMLSRALDRLRVELQPGQVGELAVGGRP